MVRNLIQPPSRDARPASRQLAWRHELPLVYLPSLTALAMMAPVERFSEQRLLFASLASSGFTSLSEVEAVVLETDGSVAVIGSEPENADRSAMEGVQGLPPPR